MNPSEFLTELWGASPQGRILVWTLRDKRSRYLRSPLGATTVAGEADAYTGVGLAHTDHGPHARTANEKVIALAGMWADIDVDGGPQAKTGACPTWDDANRVANLLATPTLLIHSGYGLQAWWLFQEPWRFTSREEQQTGARFAAQWQKLLRDRGGHGLDYTHDLARVLRIPGTTNTKGGDRRTVALLEQGPRHHRAALYAIAAQAGAVNPGYALSEQDRTRIANVTVRVPDRKLLDGLVARSPTFARTWEHQRDDLQSMSEIDLSLAAMASMAGCTDQQIGDVIVAHRRAHDDPKGERIDYLQRTIARARRRDPTPEAITTTTGSTYLSQEWAKLIRATLKDTERQHHIPLPFKALNRALDGGLAPGDVCLVAGYTSHGKSILVDMIADTAALAGKSVHLYLTEMTAYERGVRLLARRGIDFKRLRQRDLTEKDWQRIDTELDLLPYGCSIVSDWTPEDVVGHVLENKWDLAVVDLIHGFSYSDERELSKTSSAMVRAAKASATGGHLGTVIVCAAHLNDGQMRDQRSPKRPQPGLHSIKGSSSLKQDADVVIFCWQQDDEDGTPTGEGGVWIAKARNGGLAKVGVKIDAASMSFTEIPWAA